MTTPYRHETTFLAAQALCAAHGLAVSRPPNPSWHSQHMVCLPDDDVPYCLALNNAFGKLEPSKLAGAVRKLVLVQARHHVRVKAVYQAMMARGCGPLWVMVGGGAQLQVFFGNDRGYVAILYLDLESEAEQQASEGYLAACGRSAFTLQVNGKDNDAFFEQPLEVPGVAVRSHREVYGEH